MKHLHLFFPENDVALAANRRGFTPPAAALKLRRAGMLLPLWYGRPGDLVCAGGVSAQWYDSVCEVFGLRVGLFDHVYESDMRPDPWGWSLTSVELLKQQGVPADALPGPERLETLRRLSHRRSAVEMHRMLTDALPFTIAGGATELTDISQLDALTFDAACAIAKLPWSSSGRGLCDSRAMSPDNFRRQVAGMISRQGSVTIEPAYNRLLDFAMLFDYDEGRAEFAGLSVFENRGLGNYDHNIVGHQDVLRSIVSRFVPAEELDVVAAAICQALPRLAGADYSGPVGVDMLVADTNEGPLLYPTVEINFRHTMGRVARELCRFIAKDARGRFSVVPGKAVDAPSPIIENGQLVGGTLSLTPPSPDFSFLLSV